MENVLRRFLVPTLAILILGFACPPTNAARRIGGSPYDGTWSVAIYTLRGDCGSVRVAARIVGGRVYSEDQSYRASGGVGANGVVRVAVSGFGRSAAGSGRLSGNSGAEVGGHREENARVLGQPCDAQAITERVPRLFSVARMKKLASVPERD
jgi:hypothetical protein